MAGYALNPPGVYRPDLGYPERGDSAGQYYEMADMGNRVNAGYRGRTRTPRSPKHRSRSTSASPRYSRARSRSRSSRSRSTSRSRSRSDTAPVKTPRKPSFMDNFRVLYLKSSVQKKSTAKFLTTKKRQDRIQELLKSDGLGSKRWIFYPKSTTTIVEKEPISLPMIRENSDRRIKIDGDFFRKCKRSRKIDADSPLAKLKRWELILYKKLRFVQAV